MFAGKKVLVTGASSGIGRQIAEDFVRLGARVAILGHDEQAVERARGSLAAMDPGVRAYVCDLAHLEAITATACAYVAENGAPDILVNNAGYALYKTYLEMPSEELQRLVTVNFTSALLLTREFLPSMVAAGGGHVVMMASIAGRVPMTPCGPYSAAKHGLVAAAETLAAELDSVGVRVHVICPGRVEGTRFFDDRSFVERAPRRETRWTILPDAVSRATIGAIRKNRFLTYVPASHAALAWLARALPLVSRPLLHRLMRARADEVRAAAARRQEGSRERE